MGVMYVFDNLPEMADFFEHMGQRKRQDAQASTTARDRNAANVEAATFEYVVSVVRASNLLGARFLLLDDDLALAAEEVARAQKAVEETLHELNDTAVMLGRRARELLQEEKSYVVPEGEGDAD